MIGEKELEKYMDRDFHCLSHLPMNFGGVGDRYCQCGKKRSAYPCEFANLWYTNMSCSGRRDSSSDDILKVDRNTVFLTKKNLMMNQFLEYTNSTPPPSHPLKNVTAEVDDKISWFHPSFSPSRFAICNIAEADSEYENRCSVKSDHRTNISSTFCTSSSPILDKRIVSLLRGITLYWFICLNTVLAKSELLKKKSPIALVSDINCDSATALLDAISATGSTSGPPFCYALADLQVSLNLLENACDLESDILWNLFRDSCIERSQLQNHAVIVLPFGQHSKNNLFEQFVHKLVSNWIAMWNKYYQKPAPSRYCPYWIRPELNHSQYESRELYDTAEDEHREENFNYQYHWPANDIYFPNKVSSPIIYYAFPSMSDVYAASDYNNHSLANDVGFPDGMDEGRPVDASPRQQQHEAAMEIDHSHGPVFPSSHVHTTFYRGCMYAINIPKPVQINSPPQSETSRTPRPLFVMSADATTWTVWPQFVSADRHSGLFFGNNAGETPLDMRVHRRSTSLDHTDDEFALSPVTPTYPYEDEATMPVGNVTDDFHNRYSVPTQQSTRGEMSDEALWKLIAHEFGDSETNAVFANDAANANADYNVDGALIPGDQVQVEPEESLVENIVEEATTIFENHHVNVFGDWPNNVAAVNTDAIRNPYEHCQYSVENGDEVPLRQLDGEAHSSGSYSPSLPDAFERNQPTHALHYGIHLGDAQYTDVNTSLRHDYSEPRDYGSHFIYEPHHRNLINEDDVLQVEGGLSTVASNSAAQINPSYVPVAELPPEPSHEIDPCYIDVADLSPLSAPAIGADWRCHPPASAGALPDVEFDTYHQFVNKVTNVDDSKETSANVAAAPDDYESPISDHVRPASYRSSESQLTARLQTITTNSHSTHAANSNLVFDQHFSHLSSGGNLMSTNSPDFCSTLTPSAIGMDQAAAWQKSSFLELPIESADHGRQSALQAASRSASNNSGVTKEGDAPSSESDDSELIALTNAPDVHQLPPVENRYFLPQGILGGGQQECAEFNMWRWPWVNSVQLLRQEPHQPQLTDESSDEFPQYQMWKMPLVNVVNSQHPVSAHTAQQPAASAVSLLLLTPSLRSDASLNASSEYSLWSSPKLVDVEKLSSMERLSAESNNTATNPLPSHDNICTAGVQFPPFMPIIRGRVTFSNRGAFSYYRRQPTLPDGGSRENLQMHIQPSVAQCLSSAPEPVSSFANDELEADEEVHNLTDEDEQLATVPPNSPYLFRPLAPAFKVLKDVQPLMLRSASGLEYQQNGRKLLAFKHELDAKSNNPYLFQPKYAVSLNDKGCQTEPELLYACAVTNMSCSPFPVHGEPSTTSRVAHPRLSPNLAASQGWPPQHHHQPACQPAPQHLWPSYQAAVPAATVASTSQPWPTTQFPSPSQPAPSFWTAAQQPDSQTWAVGPLQYYSLNDVFSHLGQPGFANVGENDLPLAMTFSST